MPAEHPPTPEQGKEISLDKWLATDFKQQYEKRINTFNKLGILEILPEQGEMGIIGIDGQEYPLPKSDADKEKLKQEMEKAGMTMEEIAEELKKITTIEDIIRENKEAYETKLKQGFTRLQMTPFGLPLEKLALLLEKAIVKHHPEGKLFTAKDKPTDPEEKLDLNTGQPLYKWGGWIDPNAPEGQRGADVTGKCVYHPRQLTQDNHGGQTKQQILDQQREEQSPMAGWEVKLLEANINIPRENKGQTKHNRKQLETNQSSNDYLKTLLTNPQYAREQGMTLEDWITFALSYLEENNQMIDDYSGKGSACFLAGSYNLDRDVVAYAYWSRDVRRAYLGRDDPRGRGSDGGFRPAVEVKRG